MTNLVYVHLKGFNGRDSMAVKRVVDLHAGAEGDPLYVQGSHLRVGNVTASD